MSEIHSLLGYRKYNRFDWIVLTITNKKVYDLAWCCLYLDKLQIYFGKRSELHGDSCLSCFSLIQQGKMNGKS